MHIFYFCPFPCHRWNKLNHLEPALFQQVTLFFFRATCYHWLQLIYSILMGGYYLFSFFLFLRWNKDLLHDCFHHWLCERINPLLPEASSTHHRPHNQKSLVRRRRLFSITFTRPIPESKKLFHGYLSVLQDSSSKLARWNYCPFLCGLSFFFFPSATATPVCEMTTFSLWLCKDQMADESLRFRH